MSRLCHVSQLVVRKCRLPACWVWWCWGDACPSWCYDLGSLHTSQWELDGMRRWVGGVGCCVQQPRYALWLANVTALSG